MSSWHDVWMDEALAQAKNAQAAGEVPVGAVIIKDNQLIAASHNQPIALHDASAHAEIQVIRQAGQALGNYRLTGCHLYVTLEPCLMCWAAIHHARIESVHFGALDTKAGAAISHPLSAFPFNHRVSVASEVNADVCGNLLSDFFQQKRKANRKQADLITDPDTAI